MFTYITRLYMYTKLNPMKSLCSETIIFPCSVWVHGHPREDCVNGADLHGRGGVFG